jgi:hypothetical protein
VEGRATLKIPFAHVVENRGSIITVGRSGTVLGNGIYDGHLNTDLVQWRDFHRGW